MTMQHGKKKEKMREYYKNITEGEPSRYEEINNHNQINFMKSMASSVDHERQNAKKITENYRNQVGSLGHGKHLKQMSEYAKNQRNYSKSLIDHKLIKFKKFINEGPFYTYVVC